MPISLLLATPQLTGSFFTHSVVMMLEQEAGGALGLMINRPAGVNVGDLLAQADAAHAGQAAYLGGPVETGGGWCLYRLPTGHSHEIQLAPQLWLTREGAVLEELLRGEQPFVLLLGYAGWGAGQVESEVQEGSWLWGEVSDDNFARLLWHTAPEDRWNKALKLLGASAGQLGGSAKA